MQACMRCWKVVSGAPCRHVETILCSRLRKGPALDPYQRRILATPDGGSIALDFEDYATKQDLPPDAPVIILLPGVRSPSNPR